MTAKPTKDDVIKALSKVLDPELKKDLVSLNMIQNLQVENGDVAFTVVLTTPACPLRHKIETDAREAVSSLPGVGDIKITMSARVQGAVREQKITLPIKNIVGIGSGKGGVGKSTVSVNVAVSLAQSGAAVGLLDADIYGPNIPLMMGLKSLPDQNGKKITPAEAYGVKVMSIGFLVKPGQPLVWRGPMLHSTIQQFFSEVEWGELDYLIVDFPPGTGDAQISVSQIVQIDGAVIVTLPQQASIDDASRALEMFHRLQPPVPVLGIVENMSYLELSNGDKMDVFGKGGGEKFALSSETPFLGSLPIDAEVRIGGDAGVPVVISHPQSKTAKVLNEISGKIASSLSILAASE